MTMHGEPQSDRSNPKKTKKQSEDLSEECPKAILLNFGA